MHGPPHLPWPNRREAGQWLAAELAKLRGAPALRVLALPRGGVPVAWEIAHALAAPLDVFVVRKIGWPGHPEYAIGAIASGGVTVMDPAAAQADARDVQRVVEEETRELQRREQAYRAGLPPLQLTGCTALLVDDGLATGATMEAAVRAARQLGAARIVVAAPVGSAAALARLQALADEVVLAATPEPFHAVGAWYRDFPQCSDQEVLAMLADAGHVGSIEF